MAPISQWVAISDTDGRALESGRHAVENMTLDWTVSSSTHANCAFHDTSDDQTLDERHAVFALGNFFGEGNSFVKIPWNFLQLTISSKSLNVDIFPTGIISRKSGRSDEASFEIKRDAGGCIQIIARKNSR